VANHYQQHAPTADCASTGAVRLKASRQLLDGIFSSHVSFVCPDQRGTPVNPREITFNLLAKHKSAEAEAVLLKAFESEDEESRKLAAATVIKRPGQDGLLEIIRRVNSLDSEACAEFSQSPERFEIVLEHCFKNTDSDNLSAAVEFVRRTTNFTQFGALLNQLQTDDGSHRDAVMAALNELTDQLARRLQNNDETILPAFDLESLQAHRQAIIACIDSQEMKDSIDEPALPTALRSLLLLGRADEEAVINALSKRGPVHSETATRILSTESNTAVFVLLCESLTRYSPSAAIFDAFYARDDFEFLLHFLDWLPEAPTGYLKKNLKRLTELSWMDVEKAVLHQLPPTVHNRLITLANLAQVENERRAELKTWIVRQSDAAGRAAASDVLDSLPPVTVQAILHEALEDDDPEVEAWATRRLRTQKVPDTFEALVTRLDTELVPVLDAARDELYSFDLQRFLELFPNLSPAQCAQCGQTLIKINPNTPDDLVKEITHPFRWRRVRAIRAAGALDLVHEVYSSIIDALSDSEPTVRCVAIESLEKESSYVSVEAIRGLANDENRTVRDAANRVLEKLSETLTTNQHELDAQYTQQ